MLFASPRFVRRLRRAQTLFAGALIASAVVVGPASAANLGIAEGPNGLPWSLALQCRVGEPQSEFTIANNGVYLREAAGPWMKLAAQPSSPKNTLRVWKVYHADGRIGRLTLLEGPGSDGVTAGAYPYALKVEWAGVATVTGGCDRLPDRALPQSVINVVAPDELAIRATPAANGTVVAKVSPTSVVWLRGVNDKGTWVGVVIPVGNDTGETKTVSGWVSGTFVDRLR